MFSKLICHCGWDGKGGSGSVLSASSSCQETIIQAGYFKNLKVIIIDV